MLRYLSPGCLADITSLSQALLLMWQQSCLNIISDLLPVKIMSGVVITKSQDEYEDDFEKDLDWLISEESRSEDQVSPLYKMSGQADNFSPIYFLFFNTACFLII